MKKIIDNDNAGIQSYTSNCMENRNDVGMALLVSRNEAFISSIPNKIEKGKYIISKLPRLSIFYLVVIFVFVFC